MSLDIKAIIVVIAYAITINFVLLGFANLGVGFECSNVDEFQSDLDTWNYTDVDDPSSSEFRASVWDIVFNRCDDLPTLIWALFELPILIGLAYIVRGFIGAT